MKNKLYLKILRLRQHLQNVSQISYSYSQVNKTFSPLENQSQEALEEMYDFYMAMVENMKDIVKKLESEYEYQNDPNKNMG